VFYVNIKSKKGQSYAEHGFGLFYSL